MYHKEAFLKTVSFQAVTSTKNLQVTFLQTTRQHYFSCQKCNFHRFTILLSMNRLHVGTFNCTCSKSAVVLRSNCSAAFLGVWKTTVQALHRHFNNDDFNHTKSIFQISNSKLKALDFFNSPNITSVTSFIRSAEKSSDLTFDF